MNRAAGGASPTFGGTVPYRTPDPGVVDIVDAAPTPLASMSPDGRRVLLLRYRAMPTIDELSEPTLGLAGVRFLPRRHDWKRSYDFIGFSWLDPRTGAIDEIATPPHARLGRPTWSPDSSRFAFTRIRDDGVELWCVDVADGVPRRLVDRPLNQSLGSTFAWWPDGSSLLVLLVDPARVAPSKPRAPIGPTVEETMGRTATNRTYTDLLRNVHDEEQFEHFFTSILARVSLDGTITPIGEPAVFRDVGPSPDGRFLLVERVRRPYPYTVPFHRFAHTVEVWTHDGAPIALVADHGVADQVPIQGVPTGLRAAAWQPIAPATLVFADALDGGDPRREVAARDRLVALNEPFSGDPIEVDRIEHRFAGLDWLETPGLAFVSEWDRDRRWVRTRLIDVADPARERQVIFDRSVDDRYGDPGSPVHRRTREGHVVVRVEDGAIYLAGEGATPEGARPFLDRRDLETGRVDRLFRSGDDEYAAFLQFLGDDGGPAETFLARHETATTPPNYFAFDVRSGERRRLTDFPDPHPQLTGIDKQILTYVRGDGVALSGTLYLPPGHRPGERRPLLIWAYPQEYIDAGTAGQVRANRNRFTRLGGISPLMFLTQGYVVLDDATMPVVGDPATVNDTFVRQITDSARAAIDACVERGVADRGRVAVAGHSYGAFMAANLLAHTDLFRAGIARSGAYNRTLTPFGFQNERRSLWEAKEAYVEMSPFQHADRIKAPLLLIHGEEDENSGTFPLQTERMYRAIEGLGGTARMVLLPKESHGYVARESVLHVLAECFEWLDRHVDRE